MVWVSAVYFVPAFLFALFASLFYVPDFLDTPLASLTAGDLLAQLLFLAFTLISLAALARSIELDPFWPWRPGFRRFFDKLTHRSH